MSCRIAVSSHELHIFTNRETFNKQKPRGRTARWLPVTGALATTWLLQPLMWLGCSGLVLQAALEACGPCHVTVETPARAK